MIKIKISEIENIKINKKIINNCYKEKYRRKHLYLLYKYLLIKNNMINRITIAYNTIYVYISTYIDCTAINMYEFDDLYNDEKYFYISENEQDKIIIKRFFKINKIDVKN